MTEFLRRTLNRYSKLGKRRKNKRVWRKPTGRHNKIRERMRGYPSRVEIGYKKSGENKIIIIKNLKELGKFEKNKILILGKMGRRKKLEILEAAKSKGIRFQNIHAEKYLKKNIKHKQGSKK